MVAKRGLPCTLENEIFGEWDWEPGTFAAVKDVESARVMHGKPYDTPETYNVGGAQWRAGHVAPRRRGGSLCTGGGARLNERERRVRAVGARTCTYVSSDNTSRCVFKFSLVIQCTPLITRCDCPFVTGFTILDNVITIVWCILYLSRMIHIHASCRSHWVFRW